MLSLDYAGVTADNHIQEMQLLGRFSVQIMLPSELSIFALVSSLASRSLKFRPSGFQVTVCYWTSYYVSFSEVRRETNACRWSTPWQRKGRNGKIEMWRTISSQYDAGNRQVLPHPSVYNCLRLCIINICLLLWSILVTPYQTKLSEYPDRIRRAVL